MKRLLYLLPLLLLFVSCESKQSVEFTVIDGKTKMPVQYAKVTLEDGTSGFTDMSGECTLDCSIQSSYKVKVIRSGYQSAQSKVKVFAGVADDISIYPKSKKTYVSKRRWKAGEPFEGEVIEFPDVEAEFPGGTREMTRWINANIEYPETAIYDDAQGKVYLSFVVTEDGSIKGIEVERGVHRDLDSAAIEVIARMPRWTPAKFGGRNINSRCRLPIIFTLQ